MTAQKNGEAPVAASLAVIASDLTFHSRILFYVTRPE